MKTHYITPFFIAIFLFGACSGNKTAGGRSLDDCPIVTTLHLDRVKDTLDLPVSQPDAGDIALNTSSEQVEMQPIKQKEPASEKTESSKQDNKASIKETPKQEKPEMPYYTAYLENWESYFRTNNKYKDWDSKDAKMTMITATIDKYGKPHDVKVLRSCNVKKLDEEAIRLIREATTISPAKTEQREDIEMKKWVIPVYFPPK